MNDRIRSGNEEGREPISPRKAFWVGLALLPLLGAVWAVDWAIERLRGIGRYATDLGTAFLRDKPWKADAEASNRTTRKVRRGP